MAPSTEARIADSPAPDVRAEPDGFVVEVEPTIRIHFLDWGGPPDGRAGVLLVHGLGGTAWGWTKVARRLRGAVRTIALDLRGHGLSDAPTEGYDAAGLADDVIAVAEGSGLLGGAGAEATVRTADPGSGRRVVLAGHGYGAIVAAWAAAALGERCAGLVLVDGGWQDVATETGMTPDEWLRDLAEPPEVLRSMASYLEDRRSWDPPSWDADEERAARATVVEVPAGRVVPAVRPHALERSVEAIFAYRPDRVLAGLDVPLVALAAADDEAGRKSAALAGLDAARRAAGRPPVAVARLPADGHNLLRYRPDEVAGAILALAAR